MTSARWRSVRRGILGTAAAVAALAGSTAPAGAAPPLPGDPGWSLVHDEGVGGYAVTTNASGEVHAFAGDFQGTFFVHRWDATGTTSEVVVLEGNAGPAVSRGDDVFVFAADLTASATRSCRTARPPARSSSAARPSACLPQWWMRRAMCTCSWSGSMALSGGRS